jgi:hypothetical protein
MILVHLLERMFPGEAERQLPPFAQACPQFEASLPNSVREPLARAAATHQAALFGENVNDGLKQIKSEVPEAWQRFSLAALEAYFSAPAVIRGLRGGPEVLFPHARVLPEIDYDLLAPVMERFEDGAAT